MTKTTVSTESPAADNASEDKVRAELTRILESKAFRHVDRLQRFLTFIVEETLAGRGDRLKEYLVGVDVFGKDVNFDPRMDPIVRVQARRLRIRLASYYQAPQGWLRPGLSALRSRAGKKVLIRCTI